MYVCTHTHSCSLSQTQTRTYTHIPNVEHTSMHTGSVFFKQKNTAGRLFREFLPPKP